MPRLLGIDIGGTNVKAAVVSDTGAVAAFASAPWSGGEPTDAVSTARRLVATIAGGAPFAACGAGCAGLVDPRKGIVHLSPNLPSWQDVELARMLTDALGLPTVIENDATAAAWGEHAAGAARGSDDAAVLTIGTGVGGGFILGGRLYRGAHGFAGEVGHATIDYDGRGCGCGGSGCFEALVNASSVVARATALAERGTSRLTQILGSRPLTAKDVGEAADGGDAAARQALEETGRLLGVGLANLVQILDLQVIVLGGGVAAAGDSLFAPARAEMRSRVRGLQWRLPRVVPAELGEAAGVVGAALLAWGEPCGR